MNTPNPLMPQGSLPQHQSSGKSTVRIAVFTIVAIHAVFFSGLLMQGCNKHDATTAANKTNELTNGTNELPRMSNELFYSSVQELPSVPGTSAPLPLTEVAPQPSASPPGAVQSQPSLPAITPPQLQTSFPSATKAPIVAEAAPEMKEYTVVRGDSLSKIAKANKVSVTALTKANPNIEPARIQPGQKLQIPKPSPASAGSEKVADGRAASSSAESSAGSHVIKPGDTLTKIAKQHGTTISAIRAINPKLKTNRLLVGDKLKLPAPAPVPSPLSSTNPDLSLPAGVKGTTLR